MLDLFKNIQVLFSDSSTSNSELFLKKLLEIENKFHLISDSECKKIAELFFTSNFSYFKISIYKKIYSVFKYKTTKDKFDSESDNILKIFSYILLLGFEKQDPDLIAIFKNDKESALEWGANLFYVLNSNNLLSEVIKNDFYSFLKFYFSLFNYSEQDLFSMKTTDLSLFFEEISNSFQKIKINSDLNLWFYHFCLKHLLDSPTPYIDLFSETNKERVILYSFAFNCVKHLFLYLNNSSERYSTRFSIKRINSIFDSFEQVVKNDTNEVLKSLKTLETNFNLIEINHGVNLENYVNDNVFLLFLLKQFNFQNKEAFRNDLIVLSYIFYFRSQNEKIDFINFVKTHINITDLEKFHFSAYISFFEKYIFQEGNVKNSKIYFEKLEELFENNKSDFFKFNKYYSFSVSDYFLFRENVRTYLKNSQLKNSQPVNLDYKLKYLLTDDVLNNNLLPAKIKELKNKFKLEGKIDVSNEKELGLIIKTMSFDSSIDFSFEFSQKIRDLFFDSTRRNIGKTEMFFIFSNHIRLNEINNCELSFENNIDFLMFLSLFNDVVEFNQYLESNQISLKNDFINSLIYSFHHKEKGLLKFISFGNNNKETNNILLNFFKQNYFSLANTLIYREQNNVRDLDLDSFFDLHFFSLKEDKNYLSYITEAIRISSNNSVSNQNAIFLQDDRIFQFLIENLDVKTTIKYLTFLDKDNCEIDEDKLRFIVKTMQNKIKKETKNSYLSSNLDFLFYSILLLILLKKSNLQTLNKVFNGEFEEKLIKFNHLIHLFKHNKIKIINFKQEEANYDCKDLLSIHNLKKDFKLNNEEFEYLFWLNLFDLAINKK